MLATGDTAPATDLSRYDYLIGKYCICRGYRVGVWAGTIQKVTPIDDALEVICSDARRIWYWEGASTLSELAKFGTSKSQGCKFPCPVAKVLLKDIYEIIETTPEAKTSIESVAIWSQK